MRTCEVEQNFRRAKSERFFAVPSGPLGPGFAKIAAAAVPVPRLALPNQRLRCGFRRRGGCPHPPARWNMDCGPREHPHPSRLRRAPYPFCPFGTFPPIRGNRPSPLEGEGLVGPPHETAPTKVSEPCPLIRLAFARHLPPWGEGLRSGTLAQHTQAQSENCASSKFGPPRPPVGPEENAGNHS